MPHGYEYRPLSHHMSSGIASLLDLSNSERTSELSRHYCDIRLSLPPRSIPTSMISTCKVYISCYKNILHHLHTLIQRSIYLSPVWQTMRCRSRILITPLLVWCTTWLKSRETLHTERIQDEIILPALPSHTQDSIDRSLTNHDLAIHGSYSGSITHDDIISWTWVLLLSGYFGLVDESLNGLLAWDRYVSGSILAINTLSGHLTFGPRNTNNRVFTGSNHIIPYDISLQSIIELMQSIPSLEHLSLIQATTSGYIIAVDDITGQGDNQQLVLTWIYNDSVWTGTLEDHQRSIEHQQQLVERRQQKDIITIRYFTEWSSTPSRDCDIVSDLSFGVCVFTPPMGDAFISQAPLTLERDTYLASEDATSIKKR